jgi:integrase
MARKGGVDRGITQRKDREGWWVRLYVNGRSRWFKCDTKSQARALYGRLKADVREGKYFPEKFAPSKEITLRAWISRYLEGTTNRGIENERRYGRRWSLLLGKRLIPQLTTDELRRTQAKMRAKMTPLKTRPGQTPESRRQWSDATINRHFAFLRHVLMLAVKDGKLARNPVSGVSFFPEERRTRYLNDAELTNLEKIINPLHWKLVAFAIETGLRREEQFRLRWDQVAMETGILTIPLPKGGKTRHIPLSDGAQAILRSLDSFLRSPWVFPSPTDSLKPWNPQSFINHIYSPALRKAGIQGACWHTLRHTAASRRVMAGVDLVAVKEILGHRDIETTLRYSHLSPGHLKDAVNKGSLIAVPVIAK